MEHLVFRRGDFARYHVEDWDSARKLPPGVAAISGALIGIGIIVLCMDQVRRSVSLSRALLWETPSLRKDVML